MRTLKEINEDRSYYQQEKYNVWKARGGRGVFIWATGSGKTRLATHHAIPIMNFKKPEFVTKVVVPKLFMQDDWTAKGGYIDTNGLKKVEVWVINSYVTKRHICDLLIVDECHRAANESAEFFSKVFERTQFRYVMALTASLSTEQQKFLESRGIEVIDYLPTYKAEQLGFISPYKVYNIPVELSPEDEETAQALEDNFTKYKNKLGGRDAFDRANAIIRGGLNPRFMAGEGWKEPPCSLIARDEGWQGVSLNHAVKNLMERKAAPRGQKGNIVVWEDDKDQSDYTPTKVFLYGINYMSAMQDRMNYLHTAINKIDMVVTLIKKFDRKTIIFSQRAVFADAITERLGDRCASYHSKLESRPLKKEDGTYTLYKSGKNKGKPKIFGVTTLKKLILEDFKSGKIRYLSTIVSLDEGLDVPDVSLAIVASATSVARQNTQRINYFNNLFSINQFNSGKPKQIMLQVILSEAS